MTVPESPSHAGTVTLLFVDIEGSTRMLGRLGDRYAAVLRDFHRLLAESATLHNGALVDTAGDGAFFAFPTATGALQAAVAAQLGLAGHEWPDEGGLKARMGMHTGEALNVDQRYVGMDVHRAARITAAGHGGQILLSGTSRELLGGAMPTGVTLRDLGMHQLKDLPEPERIFQVVSAELPADFPPLRSLDAWPNNLPRQLSSFVGRGDAVQEVGALLGTSALLTLTGPGGVGKTRLALEVARQTADACPDGAWLIDLSAIGDGKLVCEAVASTLKIKEQPGIDLTDTLVSQIGQRQLLLLLDNCEHVLEPTAGLVDTLLQSCSEVRVLATSQEALRISGESLYPVRSLSLPDPETARLDAIATNEAVRLFVERAQAVNPGFQLNEANARSVAQICQRVDRIPLAIELAAARVRALSPDQIAARLDDRFRLLTDGGRTTMPRHRTLLAAVDWSYDLLSTAERELFARLSIFAGTFSLEAAEAVCSGGAIARDDVLDLLTRLIDRSLAVSVDAPGEARYKVLETLRQYGEGKLAATGDLVTLRRRHRDYFASLVDEARPAFFAGPEPSAWVQRLAREHDNLRAALAFSDEDPEGALPELQMAAGLWRFWEIRGHLAEGRAWLGRALTRNVAEVSDIRANALTGAGMLAAQQGDGPAAISLLESAVELLRVIGNPMSIAVAISNVANVAAEHGDLERARALYEEGVSLTRQGGEARVTAFALLNLADVAARQGRDAEAQERYDEALGTFRATGDLFGVALALGRGAAISVRLGDPASGRSRHLEALKIYRQFGEHRGIARTLMHLGDLARQGGDASEAEAFYRESLSERQQVSDRGGSAAVLGRLAALACDADPLRAARLLGASESMRMAIGASLNADDAAEQAALMERLSGLIGPAAMSAELSAGRTGALEAILEG